MNEKKYSGYIRRGIAFLIDYIPINIGLQIIYYKVKNTPTVIALFDYGFISDHDIFYASEFMRWTRWSNACMGIIIVVVFSILERLYGCTLGKAIMGIRVRKTDGTKISFRQAVVRNTYIAFFISLSGMLTELVNIYLYRMPDESFNRIYSIAGTWIPGIYNLLFIIILIKNWKTTKQGLHDRFAGSVVVRNKAVVSAANGAPIPPQMNMQQQMMQTPPVASPMTQIPPQQPVMQTLPQQPVMQTPPPQAMNQVPQEDKHRLRLCCISGLYAGAKWYLDHTLIFGRDAEHCNIVFPNTYTDIGKKHCCILPVGDKIVLMDTGSGCVTDIGDVRLENYQEIPLRAGDYFTLGKEEQFVVALTRKE